MSSLLAVNTPAALLMLTSAISACSTSNIALDKVLITASEPTQCQNFGEVRGFSGFNRSRSRENAMHGAVAISANTIFFPDDQPKDLILSPENNADMNAYLTVARAFRCDQNPS